MNTPSCQISVPETHRLEAYAGELTMSTVNLAETLILVETRRPTGAKRLREQILQMPVVWASPDVEQAQIVAKARLQFPLNLGDCFAYALAKTEGSPVLTLDADFKKCDIDTVMPE